MTEKYTPNFNEIPLGEPQECVLGKDLLDDVQPALVKAMDKYMGGFKKGELQVLAGGTGTGRSVIANEYLNKTMTAVKPSPHQITARPVGDCAAGIEPLIANKYDNPCKEVSLETITDAMQTLEDHRNSYLERYRQHIMDMYMIPDRMLNPPSLEQSDREETRRWAMHFGLKVRNPQSIAIDLGIDTDMILRDLVNDTRDFNTLVNVGRFKSNIDL